MKHVRVGTLKAVDRQFWKYEVPTCPGSSGGLAMPLSGVVGFSMFGGFMCIAHCALWTEEAIECGFGGVTFPLY